MIGEAGYCAKCGDPTNLVYNEPQLSDYYNDGSKIASDSVTYVYICKSCNHKGIEVFTLNYSHNS